MKYILLIISIALFTGCDTERIADIATPPQMAQKEIIAIFPSIPEEFCYSDSMTEIWNEFSDNLSGTNPQVLSLNHTVNCQEYGFTDCEEIMSDEDDTVVDMQICTSSTDDRVCMNVLNQEYKDSEGEIFEESCILGMNSN